MAETETSRELMAAVDRTIDQCGVLRSPYIEDLRQGRMAREEFTKSQRQFYFAVDYFSRPMSALLMRLPSPQQRLGILANVVEEHGDFQPTSFHEATFRQFLVALGESDAPQSDECAPAVQAFNLGLMGVCLGEPLEMGISALGIIEYAFADLSAIIGESVIRHGWVAEANLVHYSLHAEIDKRHAADFFQLVDMSWSSPSTRPTVEQGLRLGGYLFARLFADLSGGDAI